MAEDIETGQPTEETTNAAHPRHESHTVDASSDTERPTLDFNRYLYENLMSNLECQQEYWKRKADSQEESNPAAAQALRLKAEGLGYALRLLNAFEPEFRELVERASRATRMGRLNDKSR